MVYILFAIQGAFMGMGLFFFFEVDKPPLNEWIIMPIAFAVYVPLIFFIHRLKELSRRVDTPS